jgi:N-acetylglucosamine-6-phosphate deacetylase
MMTSVFAKKVYTHSRVFENRIISADNGKITNIQSGSPAAADHSVECLSPAFTDLQVNGGTSFNFTEKGDVEAVKDIHDACISLGTGYMLPTIITSPLENILRGIEAVKDFQQQFPHSGVLGIHLEGPFINPLKKGAHALSWIRKPTDEELKEIIHYGKGVIKLMTIAPEVFTSTQLDMLLDSGITIAAGHSNATYEEAIYAFNRGIRLVTHLFNAMSPFLARSPGLVGAAFDIPGVATPMILDGVHSTFSAARMAYKIKNGKLFLVSDALFAGRQKKRYQWGDFNAFLQDGQYINAEGNFAGSTISLGDAVRNAVFEVGIPVIKAIDMVTRRPAQAIGLDRMIGLVTPGYPAVFTVFDDALDTFSVLRL